MIKINEFEIIEFENCFQVYRGNPWDPTRKFICKKSSKSKAIDYVLKYLNFIHVPVTFTNLPNFQLELF